MNIANFHCYFLKEFTGYQQYSTEDLREASTASILVRYPTAKKFIFAELIAWKKLFNLSKSSQFSTCSLTRGISGSVLSTVAQQV